MFCCFKPRLLPASTRSVLEIRSRRLVVLSRGSHSSGPGHLKPGPQTKTLALPSLATHVTIKTHPQGLQCEGSRDQMAMHGRHHVTCQRNTLYLTLRPASKRNMRIDELAPKTSTGGPNPRPQVERRSRNHNAKTGLFGICSATRGQKTQQVCCASFWSIPVWQALA